MAEDFRHPEQRGGEAYWGNVAERDLRRLLKGFKTARSGLVPYDRYGRPIENYHGLVPVFLSTEEFSVLQFKEVA